MSHPDAAIQQLIDGNADAAVAAFGTNPTYNEWLVGGPLRKLEATGRKINYIGVDQAAIDKVNKQWHTGFLTTNVPANTLPLQEKPFMSALNRGYIAANPALPDDVAYALVKAVAKYGPGNGEIQRAVEALVAGHDAARPADDNVHPGAKKAYIELGIWDEHKKYPAGGLRQNAISTTLATGAAQTRRSPSGFAAAAYYDVRRARDPRSCA